MGNSAGDAVLVWHRLEKKVDHIWANRYEPGVGWGTPTRIAQSDPGSDPLYTTSFLGVGIDAGGNALLVWSERHESYVSQHARLLTH